MIGALSSEWLKLRSVRSSYYILGVVALAVLLAGIQAWYAASVWHRLIPESRDGEFGIIVVQAITVPMVQLCLAVLGTLAFSAECRTGMVRTSLAVTPRRGVLLTAKSLVVGGCALVAGSGGVLGAYLVAQWFVGDLPLLPGHTTSIAADVVLLLAEVLSVVVFSLLGLGLAAVLRSTAGTIVIVVVLWYLLPMVVQSLPEAAGNRVASMLLPNLPQQLVGEETLGFGATAVLSPWAALAVLVAYAAVPLGLATAVLSRRDN